MKIKKRNERERCPVHMCLSYIIFLTKLIAHWKLFSQTTGIGKTINGLRHRDEIQIAELATNLVQKWKEQAKKQSKEEKEIKPTHHNSTANSKSESNKIYENKQQTNHRTEHERYPSNLNKRSSANDSTIEEERKLKKLKQREKGKHEVRSEQHIREKRKESSETRSKV